MNDPANLPSWLSLREATQYLEAKLGRPVDEATILDVALTGHIQLSVSLPDPVRARCMEQDGPSPPRSAGPTGWASTTKDETQRPAADPESGRDHPSAPQEHREPIDGVWDLILEGSGRVEIHRRHCAMTGARPEPLPRLDGALVVGEQGEVYQLPVDPGMPDLFPASALPKRSVLGVRSSVLDDFVTAVQENWLYQVASRRVDPQPVTEPQTLGKREERTYLVIIAALLKTAKIEASDSSTAEKIKRMTERLGAPLTARTIRDKLKLVEEQLKVSG